MASQLSKLQRLMLNLYEQRMKEVVNTHDNSQVSTIKPGFTIVPTYGYFCCQLITFAKNWIQTVQQYECIPENLF